MKQSSLFISAAIFSLFAVIQIEVAKAMGLAASIMVPVAVALASALLLIFRGKQSSPAEKTVLKVLMVAEVVIVICYSAMVVGLV